MVHVQIFDLHHLFFCCRVVACPHIKLVQCISCNRLLHNSCFSLKGFSSCLCDAWQFVYFLFCNFCLLYFEIFATLSHKELSEETYCSFSNTLSLLRLQIQNYYQIFPGITPNFHVSCILIKTKKYTSIIYASDASFHVKEQKNSRRERKKPALTMSFMSLAGSELQSSILCVCLRLS